MWTGNCITYVEAAVLATDGTLGEAPPPDPCLGELLLWRGGALKWQRVLSWQNTWNILSWYQPH